MISAHQYLFFRFVVYKQNKTEALSSAKWNNHSHSSFFTYKPEVFFISKRQKHLHRRLISNAPLFTCVIRLSAMISRRRDLHICTAWRLDSRRQVSSTWALLLHRLQRRQPWKVKRPWGLSFMKTHMGVWVLFIGKNLPAIHFTGLSHIQMGVLSLKACSVTVVQLLIQARFLGLISDYDNLGAQNRKCIHVALCMIHFHL